ncbi:MAG: hypothetical protein LBV75_03205, partial [Paludibacter sp.]|nr:hypothetical protein [Paludibacter sp.]
MKDKNKQEAIEIFFVATGDYAPFVATTALSIIENTREVLNFHVLTEGFYEKDKKLLTNFIAEQTREFPLQIDFTDVSEHLQMFSGAQIGWFKSYIPYARTLIPTLFPEINKAIYIDVDIIVTCDIKEVWDIDIDKFAVAAAPEGDAADTLRERARLNLHENHQYFNN